MIPGCLPPVTLGAMAQALSDVLLTTFNIVVGGPLSDGWGSYFYGRAVWADAWVGSFNPATPTLQGKTIRLLYTVDSSDLYGNPIRRTSLYLYSNVDVPWKYMLVNGVKYYKANCISNAALDSSQWAYVWDAAPLFIGKQGQTLTVSFYN